MHIPVLLNEVVNALDPQPGSFVVDGTVDGCGYAHAIIGKMGSKGTFLGTDWDAQLFQLAESQLAQYRELGIDVRLRNENFASLPHIITEEGIGKADALVLDLGFSSEQLSSSGRGFSFLVDEPLLMTYSDDSVPVKDILRGVSEDELRSIIRTYGEERFAGRIAGHIKDRERKQKIETTKELADVIREAVPPSYEHGRIHPATRTFQALRIYANHELENLENVLLEIANIVKPGGRVAIVSFHSLEDRIVKHQFIALEKAGILSLISKKPIVPSREEIEKNPRARSAKLRIATIV